MFGREWHLLVPVLLLSFLVCSSCISRNAEPSKESAVASAPSSTDDTGRASPGNREILPRAASSGVRIDLFPVPERASIADSLLEMMKQIKEKQRERGTLHNSTPLRE